MPIDHRQPDGGFETERDGQGVLQVRAAGHDGGAMFIGQLGK